MAEVGAPSKYKTEYNNQVYKLCLLGATDIELADFFEVTEKTIHNWAAKEPEFLQARKKGKRIADSNIAEKLYERAFGYSHAEEKIFCSDGQIVRAETIKHYPPEVVAMIFWLKNRQPEYWRDKIDHQHSGEVELVRILDDIPE